MNARATRNRTCGCCGTATRVWLGDPNGVNVRVRVCFKCDAPAPFGGLPVPEGFMPATWEINQKRRERGEIPWS